MSRKMCSLGFFGAVFWSSFLVLQLSEAFVPPTALVRPRRSTKAASVQAVVNSASDTDHAVISSKGTKTLGLLTFDLDDTLYPLARVAEEANAAFAKAMESFGFEGINPVDIVQTGKAIREEMDPAEAAILTHTEIRTLAIRKEMENVIFQRKLQACADDWATPLSSLSPLVVENAKKWASNAVSPSLVSSVLNAWEMERHHAAERNLYPEVVEVFEQIKKEHPGVIIGAVTDGRANPLLMTFTLAPYFDFCMSWEDDQGGRQKFFQELDTVDGNAELTWIYDAAYAKYKDLAEAAAALKLKKGGSDEPLEVTTDEPVWIHVGDDLAYDVGGSAACGAKTILVELAEQYGQTARLRFDADDETAGAASWSTSTQRELNKRRIMNEAAQEHVNEKIHFIGHLPEAIQKILENAT